ncbi:hypothetical protein M513_01038 [Trichuris suis]|uniref:RNA-directed DNA polymerase n=1 Tax=Trichuris suis TaxID=68888 RepID=A0A085MM29_9BILA|nr:hypothetical protein M513_01038 [Trichuris suis]
MKEQIRHRLACALSLTTEPGNKKPCLTAKVQAIRKAPAPQNKAELQAFLGLVNFYNRFVPNRADVLAPLYQLVKDNSSWKWGTEQKNAFQRIKESLSSSISLAHYDSNRPLAISCDASSIGIGAVLEHINADGTHESIYFASRVLQPSEQKYAQVDREGLAIVFAVQKFRCFVLGRKFTIFMDHKPLLGLLQQGKPIKGCVSPRMTRWSLILSSYDYELRYRPGKSIGAADALSRLPVKDDSACAEPMPPEVFMLEVEPHGPVSPKDIALATARDPILSKVRTWLMSGWPHKCPSADFAPFISKRDAFSLQRDCILFGSRVVIPSQLRQEMLRMLHRSHQGVVATKAIARSYMWWPGMASAIENMISHCSTCQSVRHLPPRERIHPWLDEEVDPWSRLHIDFAGPFRGRSPAESFMGRRLLSSLDMMLPRAVRAEIARSPFATQLRVFEVGDTVLARNFSAGGPKWLRATVTGRQGKYVYVLRPGNGQLIRRHVDHVIRSNRTEPETDDLWLPSPQPLASPTSDSSSGNAVASLQ